MNRIARPLAALVALCAWVGVGTQLGHQMGNGQPLPVAAWAMLRFFTVLSNLWVAVLFSGIALGRRDWARPPIVGGTTLAILLVAVVYALLLEGLKPLVGAALFADIMMHKVTPVAVTLYWLTMIPAGQLRPRHPAIWALFPLAYLFYALIRGQVDGIYPYPFINVAELGWVRALANAFAIAIGFLAVGWGMVAFDRWRGNR